MKKTLKLVAFLFLVLSMTVFTACSDDETSGPIDNSIAGLASRNSNLTILVQALQRADLVNTLSTGGPYTVFAPTNQAFQNLLEDLGFTSLEQVPTPVLTQILLNHVVLGNNISSGLSTGYVKTMAKGSASSTNTLSMYINTASGVRINGTSNVTTPNILASNGVIHIVDAVITLPKVTTFATADPNFSTLVTALTTLTPNTDFVSTLNGAGPFTVFAPTNAAFTALDTELQPGGIAGLSESTLANVLRYHVASGNVLSSVLTPNGNTIVNPLLANTFYTITLPGTNGNIANVTDGSNRASGIVAVDVQADNGVIHVLNRVLLPQMP